MLKNIINIISRYCYYLMFAGFIVILAGAYLLLSKNTLPPALGSISWHVIIAGTALYIIGRIGVFINNK